VKLLTARIAGLAFSPRIRLLNRCRLPVAFPANSVKMVLLMKKTPGAPEVMRAAPKGAL